MAPSEKTTMYTVKNASASLRFKVKQLAAILHKSNAEALEHAVDLALEQQILQRNIGL